MRALHSLRVFLGLSVLLLSFRGGAAPPGTEGHPSPRIWIQPPISSFSGSSDEERSSAALKRWHQRFGLPQDLSNLRWTGERESILGLHITYQQILKGIPIDGAQIILSFDSQHKLWRVVDTLRPQDAAKPSKTGGSRLSPEEALDAAWNHLRVHGSLVALPRADLLYIPEGSKCRLIYRTAIHSQAPLGEWQHEIDAVTGEILSVRNTAIDLDTSRSAAPSLEPYDGPVLSRRDETDRLVALETTRNQNWKSSFALTANGSGRVFDPDPRTTLMDLSLKDTDTPDRFSSAYLSRTLNGLTLTGSVYSLQGPWVRIEDFEAPAALPSTTTTGVWTATRGNNAFNDVMTYFHIDQNQRYVQSLGYSGTLGIQSAPIVADSNGLNGADNSVYYPLSNKISFGHGCVDDNEDADTILHEYFHALQNDINPSWNGGDAGAMGEGFCDYWAGSYSLSTHNGSLFYPAWMFTWDGHNDCFAGRFMDRLTFEYDPSQTYAAHQVVGGVLGDELWSTPLFQSLLDLIDLGYPRTDLDKIVLESNFGLGSDLRMPDMATVMVNTAHRLYPSGPHGCILQNHFALHKILPQACGELPATPTAPPTRTPTATGTATPTPNTGWARAQSTPSLAGLVLHGDKKEHDMAGIPLGDQPSDHHVLCHFHSSDRWYTGIAVANPDPLTEAQVALTAYNASGTQIGTALLIVPANGKVSKLVSSLITAANQTGWIDLSSDVPILAFGLYGDVVSGGVASFPSATLGTHLILPHFRCSARWWTGISVANPNAAPENVTLNAYDDLGALLASTTGLIPANGKLSSMADALFPGIAEHTGWIKIESEGQTIAGLAVYGDRIAIPNEIAAIAGQSVGLDMCLSGFGPATTSWNALAIVNPDPSGEAQVILRAQTPDGAVLTSLSRSLPPLNRIVGMVPDLFSLDQNAEGWIETTADLPLAGLQLMHWADPQNEASGLAGIESQIRSGEIFLPHYEVSNRWWTFLYLANTGDSGSTVFTTFDNDGTVKGTVTLTVPLGGRLAGFIQDFLGSGP